MKNRYDKIVLEAEAGLAFTVRDGKNGTVIIRATRIKGEEETKPFCDYQKPPIPQGFSHIMGDWNDGFVIKDGYDSSEFVWVPVKWLAENDVIDGTKFEEDYAKQLYDKDIVQRDIEFGNLTVAYINQLKSISKYGGFYISRYTISSAIQSSNLHALPDRKPLTNIHFDNAERSAESMIIHPSISSHLLYNAEYDCVLEWFLKTNQVKVVSSDLTERKILRLKNSSSNRIVFLKDVREFTKPSFNFNRTSSIIRGGLAISDSIIASRTERFEDVGFRVALTIE